MGGTLAVLYGSTPKCALNHLEYSHVIALEESDSSKVM